ncbi:MULTISPECIES: segregation/condensation protein A [Clostridia]|uniref:segregation/condensation protein A n=1 Tax=Clostridia TaxID=186801 RepID=UPI000EA2084C|nr:MULTISPECIES: segregation/condensation protein A [Clostridia]NBJ71575.1 segregation/condensation protein A [Roseburia sp. 1XD42-34]RKI74147.1 segregation/condensation protein A [Clostridium sp. 1xD42-85]
MQAYQVKLDAFEGPLDLLLHLINQYEIDIYDIPVAQITEQYMHYIHTMKRLELNIASEYLVMAATLVEIKSKMLLPKPELNEETEEYIEDPREDLMQRLIEYRKYKEAAMQLQLIEKEANQIYTREPVAFDESITPPPQMVQGETSIYDMLAALRKMFERKKWDAPLETKIERSEIPIEQRMKEVLQKVKLAKKGILFDHLFAVPSRSHIVVTFIALLELMKKNQVYCKQEKQLTELYVFSMEE